MDQESISELTDARTATATRGLTPEQRNLYLVRQEALHELAEARMALFYAQNRVDEADQKLAKAEAALARSYGLHPSKGERLP